MFRIFNQSLLIVIFFITVLIANLGAQDTEEFFSRPAPNYPSHDPLLGWIDSRNSITLNGKWHYIVDEKKCTGCLKKKGDVQISPQFETSYILCFE